MNKKHTKKIHYVVEDGYGYLVCDNGSKCCRFPAGKFEMGDVLKQVNRQVKLEPSR